jgi:hypothetical protein
MNMKQILTIACILLMLSLSGCGGAGDYENQGLNRDSASSREKARRRVEAADLRPEERPVKPPRGWIQKISFLKKPGKKGTQLKIRVQTAIPLEENHYYSYIYWKNGEKLEKTKRNTLPHSAFKKGDLIFVDVILHQDDEIVEQRRSDMLHITNSSPVIEEVEIPEIEGPGIYRFPVKAQDPDGDKITFTMQGKALPEELTIDPTTGTITFSPTEKAPPKKIKFTITADDGDGGIAKKAVSITIKINKPERTN